METGRKQSWIDRREEVSLPLRLRAVEATLSQNDLDALTCFHRLRVYALFCTRSILYARKEDVNCSFGMLRDRAAHNVVYSDKSYNHAGCARREFLFVQHGQLLPRQPVRGGSGIFVQLHCSTIFELSE